MRGSEEQPLQARHVLFGHRHAKDLFIIYKAHRVVLLLALGTRPTVVTINDLLQAKQYLEQSGPEKFPRGSGTR